MESTYLDYCGVWVIDIFIWRFFFCGSYAVEFLHP